MTRRAQSDELTRAVEIAALLGAWRATRDDGPALVLIEGDAGMGKSWLLRSLRRRLGGSAVLLSGPPLLTALLRSGVDLLATDRDPAFLAAARHLHPAGPWAPTLIEASAPSSKEELTLAVAHALSRAAWERGGICLLLEDLHDWSHDDLGALRVLLLRAAALRAPLLLAATSRSSLDPDWWSNTSDAASASGIRLVERLRLEALDGPSVGLLASELLRTESLPDDLASWLFERASGHPLHTVELLRFLVEGGSLTNVGAVWHFRPPSDALLPRELEGVLDLRLEQARSDGELWQALAALAVLERAVELWEWSLVSALPAEQLVELGGEAARLGLVRLELEKGRERYLLAHPLYPSRLRAKLGRQARRALHALAAEAASDPGERARQARLGGHPEAVEWSWRALGEARARFAYAEVESHAQALLPLGGERRVELLHLLGEALFYRGQFEAAARLLSESEADDGPWLLALALRRLGRLEDALGVTERQQRDAPGSVAGRLEALRVSLLLQLGRERDGRRLLAELLERAESGSYARGLALLESGRDLHRGGRYREALAVTEEAVLVFRAIGDSFELFRALNNVGIYASQLGHWDLSERSLLEAIALAEARGNRVYASSRHLNLGSLWLRRGHYGSAEKAYETALRLGQASGDREVISSALMSLAEVRFLRGELSSCVELYRDAVADLEEQGMAGVARLYRMALGQAELHQGAAGAAGSDVTSGGEMDEHPSVPLVRADALLLSGRAEDAEALLAGRDPREVRDTVRAEYRLTRCLARMALGRWQPARAELDEAFELLQGSGHEPLLGQALMQAATLASLEGDQPEARRLAVLGVQRIEQERAWGHLLTLERLFPAAASLREAVAQGELREAAGEGTASISPDQRVGEYDSRPFLRTLGRFEIEVGGRGSAWKARKVRQLLALLLVASLREGGPWVARERIIAALWPESDAEKAEASFRATMKRLREALRGAGQVERSQAGEYRIDLPRCDTTRFLQSLEAGELEGALAWYGGDFLPAVEVPGLEVARERLRARFRDAAKSLVASLPPARAAEVWNRLLEDDPFDLEALERLLECLAAFSDEGRVRQTVEVATKRWREEFGEVPAELAAAATRWLPAGVSR